MNDTNLSHSPQFHASCDRCCRAVEFEVMVTDDVWAQIGPNGDETGYLCFWCMDAACVERGMDCVPCIINVGGRALSSGGAAEHVEVALSLAHRTIERQARRIHELDGTNDQRGGSESTTARSVGTLPDMPQGEREIQQGKTTSGEPLRPSAAAPSFSVGDLVEYVGTKYPTLVGRRGTVTSLGYTFYGWRARVQFELHEHNDAAECFVPAAPKEPK